MARTPSSVSTRPAKWWRKGEMGRPEFVTDKILEFLDDLRESGETNMYGARPYVLRDFPELTKREAGKVLSYWMKTFGDAER